MELNYALQREAIARLFNLGMSEEGGKVPARATGRMSIAGLAVAIKQYGPYVAGKLSAAAGLSARDAMKAALISREYLGFTYLKEKHDGKQGTQDRT